MRTIRIQELEGHLDEAMRRVQEGENLLVTDRGEVVAELRQPQHLVNEGRYPELRREIQEGSVLPARRTPPGEYPSFEPLLPAGRVQQLLDEERASN